MKTLQEKITRGKEAIAKAKAAGKDTTEWEKHLAGLESEKAVQYRLFQYLCDKIASLTYSGDQENLKAFWTEADKINEMADRVVEGRANFEEWRSLVDKWISSMDNSLFLRCSRCGRSHDEIKILLDVAWFEGERTVCWKCWKRLS